MFCVLVCVGQNGRRFGLADGKSCLDSNSCAQGRPTILWEAFCWSGRLNLQIEYPRYHSSQTRAFAQLRQARIISSLFSIPP